MPNFLTPIVNQIFKPTYLAHDIPIPGILHQGVEMALAKYNPTLLDHFYQVVKPSAEQAIAERDKLEQIKARNYPLIYQYTEEKAGITAIKQAAYQIEKPKDRVPKSLRPETVVLNPWSDRVTIAGLSLMLALGISHYFEIDIKNVRPNQWLLLVMAIVGAVGIVIATKRAIVHWVVKERELEAPRIFPDRIAFWERLQAGDTLAWMSIGIPVFEMCFAAPGLIELLPPDVADNPFSKLSTFMVAGLTAMVNVFMAWGQGWEFLRRDRLRKLELEERSRREQEYQLAIQQRNSDVRYQQYCQREKSLADSIDRLHEEIEIQARIAHVQFDRAKQEYEQWKRLLDRWSSRNRHAIANV